MTVTIPDWVLYALGGVVGLFVLAMAAIGVVLMMLVGNLPGGRWFDK